MIYTTKLGTRRLFKKENGFFVTKMAKTDSDTFQFTPANNLFNIRHQLRCNRKRPMKSQNYYFWIVICAFDMSLCNQKPFVILSKKSPSDRVLIRNSFAYLIYFSTANKIVTSPFRIIISAIVSISLRKWLIIIEINSK